MIHAGDTYAKGAMVRQARPLLVDDVAVHPDGDFAEGFEQLMLGRVKDLIAYLGDARTQLMYGTDWPLVHIPSYVAFFDDLPFDDGTRECVAWRTAARLFGVDIAASERAARSSPGSRPRAGAPGGTTGPV